MEGSLDLTSRSSRSNRPKFSWLTTPSLPLLCISLFFLFLAPSHGGGKFSPAPDHLFILVLSQFTNTTKKAQKQLCQTQQYGQFILKWTMSGDEEGTFSMLWAQCCTSKVMHLLSTALCSIWVLQGLTTVGLYLHLSR